MLLLNIVVECCLLSTNVEHYKEINNGAAKVTHFQAP
jgi:hypothetical protein